LKGTGVIPENFKAGDRVHIEAAQAQLQNFGERLFLAFARTSSDSQDPVDINTATVQLENYIKYMKKIVASAYAPRLEFLINLYVSPSNGSMLTYDSVTALFREAIALYHHLHTKEEMQIMEFGYCVVDEPEYPSIPTEDLNTSFAPLKSPKSEVKSTNTRPKTSDTLEIEVIEPPKAATPASSFVVSPAVPKHKIEDVLPSDTDIEQQLMKEVLQRREAEKERSRQSEALGLQIVSSIVSSIFQESGHGFQSGTSAEERSKMEVEQQKVKSWILNNIPKAGDVLLALVRLEVSSSLEPSANELVKRQYQRVAPQPDGLNMDVSLLWNSSLIWTMHQCFELKNIGSFKLLYSSATHGRSLNRFVHHVIGYKSETVFLIYTTKGEIFGAFVATPWEMGSTYWGNSNCFLFGISPVLSVCRPLGSSSSSATSSPNFVYFFTNKKSFTGKPVGIGFGGVPGNFRLWVDEDMLSGSVRTMDPTFETGALAGNPAFDIASIEVWGSATDYAEAGLLRERRLRVKDAERARKAVAKEGAWNEGADKFIMDLVGKTGHSDGIVESIQKEKREAIERERQIARAAAKLDEMEREKARAAVASSSPASSDATSTHP